MRRPHIGAYVLIVVGTLFLLRNLGLLPELGPFLAKWWPLIPLSIGVGLLVRHHARR